MKNRFIKISSIAIALIVLLITSIYIYQQKRILLPVPVWNKGDWFEFEVQSRSRLTNKWMNSDVVRYEVIGEESIVNIQCYVLGKIIKSSSNVKNQIGGGRLYFRKSDLLVVGYKILPWSWEKPKDGFYSNGFIPLDIGIVPVPAPIRFPVYSYQKYFSQSITNAKIDNIESTNNDNIFLQNAYHESVIWNFQKINIVRINVQGYSYRWIPGALIWGQCWDDSPGKSKLRARLVGCSKPIPLIPMPKATDEGVMLEK